MAVVKRVLAGVFLLALTAAGVYGYTVGERERAYRQFVAEGEADMASDNTYAAIEAFSSAIALKEASMIGYLKRGETYLHRGEMDAAMRDLRRAADLDPAATRPLEELGDVNLAIRPARYGRASDLYRAYVRLDPSSPKVLYKLAFSLYNDGHSSEAVETLNKAIALDDKVGEAYYLLGLCQRDAQHLDQARRALEQAILLKPMLLHAHEDLADLYGLQRRTDDRLAQLEALSGLDPGPSREIELGQAYARAGQTDRAILTLGRAAERYPDHPYAYVALGRIWLEIAQERNDRVALSKALEALEGAVGSDDSSEALMLFGRALLMTSDDETAERMLQDATQKQPVEPLAFYYLADAAERLGHDGAARQALEDYAVLRGDEPDARRRSAQAARLGGLSMKLNEPAVAATDFLLAARDAADDPALLARAAEAQWRAGDADAARSTVTRVLDKDPGNPLARTLKRRLAPPAPPKAQSPKPKA